MIEFINVSKTFDSKSGIVHAVKDVNLHIESGEIFGVIGYSGAGKSTLVRCINLLERPTQGSIIINGTDITSLKAKDLRLRRRKIGMIFQQFNLMGSRTVFDNVAFALKGQGIRKEQIQKKVYELLELVEISDKAKAYPSQLSGGQKQRVAIARSLANDPDILLCDEATSALDPQTTQTILNLIKDLNKRLNITVVIITHEMAVIKDVCDRVAVMEQGNVVEFGRVSDIFANPQKALTKDFINTSSNLTKLEALVEEKSEIVALSKHQKLLKVDFFGEQTSDAVISHISSHYHTEASIIFANVEVIQELIMGSIVLVLSGSLEDQDDAIHYLNSIGVKTEVLKHGPVV